MRSGERTLGWFALLFDSPAHRPTEAFRLISRPQDHLPTPLRAALATQRPLREVVRIVTEAAVRELDS